MVRCGARALGSSAASYGDGITALAVGVDLAAGGDVRFLNMDSVCP